MLQNLAAELGPSRFPWWPDWRGECVAIVASGPSVKKEEVEKLRGHIHVIAIKESVNLCPWADAVYGCDGHWWVHRKGLSEFGGLKLFFDPKLGNRFTSLTKIEIKFTGKPGEPKWVHEILLEQPGLIGSGGNSGFQALNLAVQFGVTGVLLLGFDMNDSGKPHWYGRTNWLNGNNPGPDNFSLWRKSFANAVPVLRELGVDVVNASAISSLQCFPKMSVDDALRRWGL